MRNFSFDFAAMAGRAELSRGGALAADGGNLSAVLAARQRECPEAYARVVAEFTRILPEYSEVRVVEADGMAELRLRFAGENWISGAALSQGTLYVLALLSVAFDPRPPPLVCIDEVERGLHPRLLREIRDALYRLSYPEKGAATQVLVTSHSPYLLDLFREHPEEVLIAGKEGRSATFLRLSEVPNLGELLGEGALGELWYSGIFGGVPEA
jgi:predicted ATPase